LPVRVVPMGQDADEGVDEGREGVDERSEGPVGATEATEGRGDDVGQERERLLEEVQERVERADSLFRVADAGSDGDDGGDPDGSDVGEGGNEGRSEGDGRAADKGEGKQEEDSTFGTYRFNNDPATHQSLLNFFKTAKHFGIATQSTLMTSEHSSRRAAADLAQYGASSRIVLLQGMVGSLAELDGGEEEEGELASDVAEECSKHGVVVRVVIHRVGEDSRLFREEVIGARGDASKAVRIFVVFPGVAGAWTAMKALDGRFFGGRTVRARYFDEGMFERGQRDE
jgi:hypothetical protein